MESGLAFVVGSKIRVKKLTEARSICLGFCVTKLRSLEKLMSLRLLCVIKVILIAFCNNENFICFRLALKSYTYLAYYCVSPIWSHDINTVVNFLTIGHKLDFLHSIVHVI